MSKRAIHPKERPEIVHGEGWRRPAEADPPRTYNRTLPTPVQRRLAQEKARADRSIKFKKWLAARNAPTGNAGVTRSRNAPASPARNAPVTRAFENEFGVLSMERRPNEMPDSEVRGGPD